MIILKYQLENESFERELIFSLNDFYDSLEEGESFLNDGVEKYLDPRNYIEFEKSKIIALRYSTPQYTSSISYGEKGSITQHTIYKSGDEMLITQSNIEEEVIHSCHLEKSAGGEWKTAAIELIFEKTAKIVSLK